MLMSVTLEINHAVFCDHIMRSMQRAPQLGQNPRLLQYMLRAARSGTCHSAPEGIHVPGART
jgi:hypothetical protein